MITQGAQLLLGFAAFPTLSLRFDKLAGRASSMATLVCGRCHHGSFDEVDAK